MDESYRGFLIRLEQAGSWHAIIIEASTGATLPTKATALAREGSAMALDRARRLCDIYARALSPGADAA